MNLTHGSLSGRRLHSRPGRALAILCVAGLLAGCGTGSVVSSSPSPSTVTTTAPTPTPAASNLVARDVEYAPANSVLAVGRLDVYAPAGSGPWPVVVMLHGSWGSKEDLADYASRVASRGYLVFAPTWGAGTADWTKAIIDATATQVACAVAFAGAHASTYGGDAGSLMVFGWSAGAAVAAADVFGRVAPDADCPSGASLPSVHSLVLWEGDWLFAWLPDWDAKFAADPSIYPGASVWSKLSLNKTIPVAMLVSETPGMPDLPLSQLPVRDPTGVLRKQLEANGALADSLITDTESQQLLYSLLKAQGNPVTIDVMPGSSHMEVADGGWPVFLAAFDKAAAG